MKEKDKLLKAIYGASTLKMRLNRFLLKRQKAFLCWTYCDGCEVYMLICPKCGNNCCNAGYGKIDDKDCDMCEHVYQLQDWAWKSEKWEKLL